MFCNTIRLCYKQTLILALSALLSGCSGSDGRLPISGLVTVNGKPLGRGTIAFRPVDLGTAGTSGATIENGKFQIHAVQGLLPGKYIVIIQGFKESGRMIDDPQAGKRPELIPLDFAKLEATVVSGRENHFDFHLDDPKTE